MNALNLVVASLAVWRLTHLFHSEDGPWDVLVRFRRLFGDSVFGRMLDCFFCLSLWVALPFALTMGPGWKQKLLLWPALSGAACLLERPTKPAAAVWYEEPQNSAVGDKL